jgi:tRNA threonylcarbamoyl adenosine modification protein (Sua5/YciO/YrdC/YwlC family)
MLVLDINPVTPQARHIRTVVEHLQTDCLVLYPTDSGYAVGCDAESPKAIHRLYALKKPLKKFFMALLLPDLKSAKGYAKLSDFAFNPIKPRVPGPYTFILPADPRIARKLEVKRPEIGVRISPHPFLRALFEEFGRPLLSTAAKLADDQELTRPDQIEPLFHRTVDVFARIDPEFDDGEIPLAPTTVANLTRDELEIIRGEWA